MWHSLTILCDHVFLFLECFLKGKGTNDHSKMVSLERQGMESNGAWK